MRPAAAEGYDRLAAAFPHQLLSYGQPEIAVAAGTIVIARDGIPNSPPPHDPTPPPLARLTGNYVELRMQPIVQSVP